MKTWVVTTKSADGKQEWKVGFKNAEQALDYLAEALRLHLVVVAVEVRS